MDSAGRLAARCVWRRAGGLLAKLQDVRHHWLAVRGGEPPVCIIPGGVDEEGEERLVRLCIASFLLCGGEHPVRERLLELLRDAA
jgi:hypothetical protein